MRLEEPLWLLACLPAAAAAWAAWAWLEPRRAAWSFPDGSALRGAVPVWGARLARSLPYLLKAGVLLLCAGALARPQAVRRQSAGLTEGIDILLVTDTSTSMRALDFAPSDRMDAAKQTARRFVGARTADRIGLVVFGGAPLLACPLTLDYEALLDVLDGLEAGMTGAEGTAIGDGIATGVSHLKSGRAPSKVIILLTDGRSNAGVIDPVTAAKAAASYGIKIYAIGTGKKGQSTIPVDDPMRGRVLATITDDIDEDTLTLVAASTGGRYFRATSVKELAQIYAEIDGMEKAPTQRPQTVSYRDLYPWLLVPALLLLSTELFLARTVLLRIP
ncbi:MAG: VWA domain-containing protein [Elusimicrobia bacterium]|nr:VWA domain-containing protein [Elusimicrobiota bacterium]